MGRTKEAEVTLKKKTKYKGDRLRKSKAYQSLGPGHVLEASEIREANKLLSLIMLDIVCMNQGVGTIIGIDAKGTTHKDRRMSTQESRVRH